MSVLLPSSHVPPLVDHAYRGPGRSPSRPLVFTLVVVLHCALFMLLYSNATSRHGEAGSRSGSAHLNVFKLTGVPVPTEAASDADARHAIRLNTIPQDEPQKVIRPDAAMHDGAGIGDASVAKALASVLADDPLAGGSGDYDAVLRRHITRYARHPEPASARFRTGIVVVRFRVARDGQVIDARVLKTQGADLDEAALAALWRAEPLPHVPADLPAPLEVDVPIDFMARQ